jgi:endonuclease/exonuclease/phosphatase family metal-dependent hydrolase
MKILYFNAYNGKGDETAYFDLLRHSAAECEVLCLQEVDSVEDESKNVFCNMLGHHRKTREVLEEAHYLYFAARQNTWAIEGNASEESDWGMVIAVRKDIPIVEYREKYILYHRNAGVKTDLTDLPVLVQAIKIKRGSGEYLWVLNFHGYYAGGFVGGVTVGKSDTPERIDQAWKLVQFVVELQEDCPVVLGGDFNLNPDTLLIQKLSEIGMQDLIAKYNIPTTRTPLYKPEKRAQWPFADYVFVDPRLTVQSFTVDAESLASDHAPMVVELG